MTTPKMVWYEGVLYYITARGNHRNDIFRDEEDFECYLKIIEEALLYYTNYNYGVIAYCLMDNHVHLNPVKAKMVENPSEYKWSSYKMFIGEEDEKLIVLMKIIPMF